MTLRVDRMLLAGVAELLEPLIVAARTDQELDRYLSQLGWDSKAAGLPLAGLRTGMTEVSQVYDQITALAGNDDPSFDDVVRLITAAGTLIQTLTSTIKGLSGFASQNLAGELAADVAADLLHRCLQARAPRLRAALLLTGLIELTPTPPLTVSGGATVRTAGLRLAAHPERLTDLATDLPGYLRARFMMDGARRRAAEEIADLVGPLVVDALAGAGALADYGIPMQGIPQAQQVLVSRLLHVALITPPDAEGLGMLRMVAGLMDANEQELAAIVGLSAVLSLDRQLPAGTAHVSLTAASTPLSMGSHGIAPVAAGAPVTFDLKAAWDIGDQSGAAPVVRLGAAQGPRLQVDTAHVEVDSDTSRPGVVRLTGQFAIRLVAQRGHDDGFLAAVMPAEPVEVSGQLKLTWDPVTGLRVTGGAALSVDLPLGTAVGPLTLQLLHLSLQVSDAAAKFAAGLDFGVGLGPFQAAIAGLGLQLESFTSPGGGALGGLEVKPSVKPPTGAGLAIQSPAVSGGGFLLFDPGAGQYAGVFELTIVGTISVKAIAIITTKMPDGSPGFALLILITAEGFTPIQLGMGFSLTGIGGLLALNHTVDADAVRGGLRSGVLDSVLFVKDPVKNAPRVISTLNHVFPLAADRLLIGPLAEISWGTPPLVKIRLALLLEVPQPIRVILLAALSMMLPTPQDAVVEIHIDSIGVLDFGKRELALDASLHDSRILQFTLTGDMALRLNWGDEPALVMSIGGFHPRFTPPKGLRPLNRLALTLSSGDNPRVRFEAYLALTSNTIQMGARVDVHAEEGPFTLDGGGSFDALIQWSPFALDVAFAAWAKITSGGSTLLAASVALEVTGPRSWHLTGQASVQVLAFTATVGVDFTVGTAPSAPEVTETVDVGAEIWAQLSDPACWAATLPSTATPGVTLAGLPVASGTAPLVAHPLATVSVREQIAPLGTPIERVGGRLPVGGTRSYTASVSAPAGVVGGTVTELFAPGQYANLPDDARLAGPSFKSMTGGVSLIPQTAQAAGPVLTCDLAVQTLDVTSLDAPAIPGAWVAAEAGTARGPVPAPPMGRVTT
jgi:hypothetical protein